MADVYGIQCNDLPEQVVPLECIVLIKAIDDEGDLAFFTRNSDNLTTLEAIGMLRMEEKRMVKEALSWWTDELPDDEADDLEL